MTTQASGLGSVYERGYRRWDGKLRARTLRFLPVATEGVRLLLKPRGSVLRNLLQYGLYGIALVPFLAFAVLIYLQKSLEIAALLGAKFDASKAEFYPSFFQIELGFVLLFSLVTGSGLIANDMRRNALEIYFSRPLKLHDYLAGKLLVIGFFLASITLFPALLLWLIDYLLTSEPGYLVRVAPQLVGVIVFSTILIGVHALTVLAVSSLTRRGWVAAVIWVSFMLASEFTGHALAEAFDSKRWLLVSPANAAMNWCRCLFSYTPPGGETAGAGESALALVGYLVVGAVILYLRVRAVHVVKD
ncbi:MAG: hypothetical protein AB1486_21045 [Planctomycetota bacterium]